MTNETEENTKEKETTNIRIMKNKKNTKQQNKKCGTKQKQKAAT